MIFSINCRDIESLYVERLHEKRRNTLTLSIDHPTAKQNYLKTFLKSFLMKRKPPMKVIILQEISFLSSQIMMKIKKVQDFLNLIYQNGMIPIMYKPTRVTKKMLQQQIISLLAVLQKILLKQQQTSQMFQNIEYFRILGYH